MIDLAAVLIGGPPDSGKSVLTARLTHALRERGVAHYVLRATPDGEGDWTALADRDTVRTLLVPRHWTPDFCALVCRDLAARHLPLLVDAGGRPQPWQEPIFDRCTHAVLLTRDPGSHAEWQARAERHHLLPVADLHSDLDGQSRLLASDPVIRGVVAGLAWNRPEAPDPVLDVLTARLAALLTYDPAALRRRHERLCPAEMMVDLERLAGVLDVPRQGEQALWRPMDLPPALDYVPAGVPLGLYGRGPNWLYAALTLLAWPAVTWLFDARLGWVQPVPLCLGVPTPDAPLQVTVQGAGDWTRLSFALPQAYLDYFQARPLLAPAVPAGQGVILDGKLPHWLTTGLALLYRPARWVAVYQPQLKGAVVVWAQPGAAAPGQVVALE